MNNLTFQALRLLADGEFHSGEHIARALGVSRASVWNALHGLEGAGVEVFRVRGRGYRLPQPLDLLDAQRIVAGLGAAARDFRIAIVERAESTNSLLLAHAAAGAPSGSVLAAEWQTAGRGRRGRPWHSALGGALTFSLLWRFQQGAGLLAGLSLAVGVAVTRALAAVGVGDAGLKWPNDVIWRHCKLAGILIEMQGDALGPSVAVIGVGLNCRLPDALRERIDQPVVDLATARGGELPDRNRVLALLLVELGSVLKDFSRHGFAPLRAEWQGRHIFHGKPVELAAPDGTIARGIVTGVAEDGAVLLACSDGKRRFHSGDISLRGAT